MLGLHSFTTPQFYIPQIPQTERPLHKAKDFMSFLNSLQWKADDDAKQPEAAAKPEDEQTRDVTFDMNKDTDDRRGAEAALLGLDASLHSGHDVTQRIGTTRWDGMDDSQLWKQAMNFVLTGEDPITRGYGDKIGMTPNDVVFHEEEANKMPLEKRLIGYDPYHRLEALRNSVPGIDPSLMTKVGW